MTMRVKIALGAAAVVIFALGFLAGRSGPSAEVARLTAQIDKAKQRLSVSVSANARALTGRVTAVNGNVVTLAVSGALNPFEEVPATREVVVTDTTVIERQSRKDPATLQRETAAYQQEVAKARAEGVPPGTPPSPLTTAKLALSDLKAGDAVLVEAGEDIQEKARFEATDIQVLVAPAAPARAPAGK